MDEINVKNLDEAIRFLKVVLDELKTDTVIQRSTFTKDKFEVEQTVWDAIHLLNDLRDYWHITGRINKFDGCYKLEK